MFDISIDDDEVQSERDFFWAIAFPCVEIKLIDQWKKYGCLIDLSFKNIHQILDEFDDFTGGSFDPGQIEIFVAQRIWINKCAQDRVLNPEFGDFLKLSNLTRWAYAGIN